jgi:hypothetical protein
MQRRLKIDKRDVERPLVNHMRFLDRSHQHPINGKNTDKGPDPKYEIRKDALQN